MEISVETRDVIGLNDDGRYSGPNLPIGDHRILVKETGFKTAKCQPVVLKARARVRLDVTTPGGGQ
jgi:hypothetical protein